MCLQICLSSQKGRENSDVVNDENTKEAERGCAQPGGHWFWELQVPKATDWGKSQALVLGGRVNQEIMGSCSSPGSLHVHQKISPSFWRGVCLSLLASALVGIGESLPLRIQFQVYLHAELVLDVHK